MVRKNKLISGEILKEPLLDVLLTDLEQISFSLLCPRPSWVPEDLRERDHPDSIVPAGVGASSFARNANKSASMPRSTFVRSQAKQPLTSLREVRQAKLFALRNKVRTPRKNEFLPIEALAGQRPAVAPERLEGSPLANQTTYGRPFEEEEASQQITLSVKIGDYVHCGDKIGALRSKASGSFEDNRNIVPVIIGDSGRVITLTKTQLTLQKTQPVLYYSEATSHVRENEWVQRGSPILTLTHQTLVTGDIVQGIPRIEQLFEAVTSSSSALPDDEPLYETLHSQAREIFRRNWSLVPLPTAVRQALEEIQQIIVESIQKVYLSQGVLIADKHIEIIVKQMTSKGQIIDNGNTGFIINEVLPLQKIENANLTTSGKKAVYAPAVVGLTRAALNSDSFVSAASFQETTRVLTRDAVAGKSDFLRGLKEKVVIGDLISAGTGLDLFFLYTLLAENIFDTTCEKMSGLRKPRPNKYESSIRRI